MMDLFRVADLKKRGINQWTEV